MAVKKYLKIYDYAALATGSSACSSTFLQSLLQLCNEKKFSEVDRRIESFAEIHARDAANVDDCRLEECLSVAIQNDYLDLLQRFAAAFQWPTAEKPTLRVIVKFDALIRYAAQLGADDCLQWLLEQRRDAVAVGGFALTRSPITPSCFEETIKSNSVGAVLVAGRELLKTLPPPERIALILKMCTVSFDSCCGPSLVALGTLAREYQATSALLSPRQLLDRLAAAELQSAPFQLSTLLAALEALQLTVRSLIDEVTEPTLRFVTGQQLLQMVLAPNNLRDEAAATLRTSLQILEILTELQEQQQALRLRSPVSLDILLNAAQSNNLEFFQKCLWLSLKPSPEKIARRLPEVFVKLAASSENLFQWLQPRLTSSLETTQLAAKAAIRNCQYGTLARILQNKPAFGNSQWTALFSEALVRQSLKCTKMLLEAMPVSALEDTSKALQELFSRKPIGATLKQEHIAYLCVVLYGIDVDAENEKALKVTDEDFSWYDPGGVGRQKIRIQIEHLKKIVADLETRRSPKVIALYRQAQLPSERMYDFLNAPTVRRMLEANLLVEPEGIKKAYASMLRTTKVGQKHHTRL